MQYLLSQEEYSNLKEEDSKFNQLEMILHKIEVEPIDDKSKLELFRTLVNDLGYADQAGTTDAILDAWSNRP